MERKRGIKGLLVSLPWTEYQAPCLPVGHLSSYLRERGFDVSARHDHLEFAIKFNNLDYDIFSHKCYAVGEAIFAAILFKKQREQILRFIDRSLPRGRRLVGRARRILREIYRSCDWSKYSVIGFSTNHAQLFASLLFASWLKRDHPNVRIVLGGSSVAGRLGKSIIEYFDFVDWCIDGEGEQALEALFKVLQKEGTESSVPGLIYRTKDGVKVNDKVLLNSLSGFPDPDYDHYFEMLESVTSGPERPFMPYLPVEESRGCVNRCAFCNFNYYYSSNERHRPYRPRPAEEIASAIERLVTRYKTSSVYIVCLNLTSNSCRDLFSSLDAKKRDYRIFSQIHAGMPKEDISLMKRMGVMEVQIGLESFATSLLKKMNKGTRLIDNLEIMKFCEELGIRHNSNLMIGFPTETQAEVDRCTMAIDYAASYRPFKKMPKFELREGSPVHLNPRKYGIKSIRESALFGSYLEREYRGINLWYKSFETGRKRRDYRALFKRIDKWRCDYEDARKMGLPLLFYSDFEEFLIISDNREGHFSIVLDGWRRELYLFCDQIRGHSAISERFSDIEERDLDKFLTYLFRMKLIFIEDGFCLSLAIRCRPGERRFMPYMDLLWKQ